MECANLALFFSFFFKVLIANGSLDCVLLLYEEEAACRYLRNES